MAAQTQERAAPANERLHPAMIQGAAFIVIVTLAVVLRFGELAMRTFQPGEAITALMAADIARGGGYEHLPVEHGPFQYFTMAAAFKLFGVGDFTARLAPALFGVLLAAVPFTMTKQLGRTGTITAALLLVVSPTVMYYSRFAGPDIYLAVFSLLAAGAIWRYLDAPQRVNLYALAASLALMVITSEMALAIVPAFIVYLWYRTGAGFIEQMESSDASMQADEPVDHYVLLGVERDATAKDVRLAYRKLIETTDERSEREALAHAYGVLTNENRRAAYDRRLARTELASSGDRVDEAPGIAAKAMTVAGAGVIAALWPFMRGLRSRLGLRKLPAAADPLLVTTLLMAPFYGPLVEKIGFIGDRGFEGQMQVFVFGGTTQTPGGELPVMLITLASIVGAAMVIGMAWRWHAWVVSWAAFYGIALTAFTGFFTNAGGVWTGLWGTLDYWSRPEAEVHSGPVYYYAMILPVYEFLPLAVAGAGLAFMAIRGSWLDRMAVAAACAAVAVAAAIPASAPVVGALRQPMAIAAVMGALLALRMTEATKFLAVWAAGAFFAFTMIGEKQPWLAIHMAVPMALLASRIVNDAIAAVPVPVPALPRPSLRMVARPRLVQASYAAIVAGVSVFTMQSGMLASWGHGNVKQLENSLALSDAGDTPIELLQPDTAAGDIQEVRYAIEKAGVASGKGHDLTIVIDTSHGFARTWLWYLRDYPNMQLEDLRRPFAIPPGAIVLADARNRPRVTDTQSSVSITYVNGFAFPVKRYDGLSAADIAGRLVSGDSWSTWGRYLRDRESIGALQTYDGVAYFPLELSVALPMRRAADVLAAEVTPEPR